MNARAAAWSRLSGVLAGVPTRTVLLAMAAVLLLVILEGWLLLLRTPWAEYQRIRQNDPIGSAATAASTAAAHIRQLERELQDLDQRVKTVSTEMTTDRLVLMLVDRLSNLARMHAVNLGGVRVGSTRHVFKFEEVSFDIQVSGRYQSLVDLLREMDQGLKPVSVGRFSIGQADATGKLNMEVRLVAYRHSPAGESEK